ncbi:hypothetical protein Taro_020084 [Colocasia esculenta]|uniref:Uncharacterized protein n=1 Tax=Colocasia esculenta TaxID=4460 RepID=A0A843UVI0_COLES|nr:hypothetical protein [Colocasia esculenta]
MSSGKAYYAVLIVSFLVSGLVQRAGAQYSELTSPAVSPAPMNDATAIDQGIAYVLMALALLITYLILVPDTSVHRRESNESPFSGKMASLRAYYAVLFISFLMSGLMQLAGAQLAASSPAASPEPMSDATAIDQAVAYVIMAVALLITYLVH